MNIDLNVLNHLGLNLYSNTPSVLSEVIANSWDADATIVNIECDQDSETIVITDNGNGMDINDINEKFLCVGYRKRENGEALSKKGRSVMGRKGIGKLSLLSIADNICIYSKKNTTKESFCLSREDIEGAMNSKNASYTPKEIEFVDFEYETGTKIVIKQIKKNISKMPEFLKKRIARRFSVLGNDFRVFIGGTEITIEDRDYFNKIQFLWPINLSETQFNQHSNISIQSAFGGSIQDSNYIISGWIGAVEKPSDLSENNKISIITRGKLAQEDILSGYQEGGIYASYLIGEIHADFLDSDNERDISTSNRQQYMEDDERYQALSSHIYKLLKNIQKNWTNLRKEKSTEKILGENPAIYEWYKELNTNTQKYAKKLFATIEGLHYDKEEKEKKELLKYGILAFERLKISDKLNFIDDKIFADISKYGEIFSDLQEIEATLYWEIANERVKIIRQLSKSCDDNAKEKILQEYIFDNLWLLNPSWERATAGTERMEERVAKEFELVNIKLSEAEQKGRIDIRYRSSSGKHIIIELKRYIPTYKVDIDDLHRQIRKYRDGLKKCLESVGRNEPIEIICIIGKNVIDNMTLDEANNILKPSNGRIITYDKLIEDSLNSYQGYLDTESKIGKLRQLIDKI